MGVLDYPRLMLRTVVLTKEKQFEFVRSVLPGVTCVERADDISSETECLLSYNTGEGAVANVVGIRRGAISGNMMISFQAARSIG